MPGKVEGLPGFQIGIDSEGDLEDSTSPDVIAMKKAGKIGAKKKKKIVG